MIAQQDIVLLDGGMGQELKARGITLSPTLWSAAALIEAPEVVVEAHAAFIEAGADVITTSNYAVVPAILARDGIAHRLEELTRLSMELARKAVEKSGRRVRIAGSLPPMEASYRPELAPDSGEAVPVYGQIASLLAEGCDLLICETMASGQEARNAARGAVETGLPVWVAYTLEDDPTGRLRSGEELSEAVALLDGLPIAGLLINCTAPESTTHALPHLRGLTDLPVGAYANGFEPMRGHLEQGHYRELRDLSVDDYAAHVRKWLQDGATIVGGCCGIGPRHIAAMREIVSGEEAPN